MRTPVRALAVVLFAVVLSACPSRVSLPPPGTVRNLVGLPASVARGRGAVMHEDVTECARLCDDVLRFETPEGAEEVFLLAGKVVGARWTFDKSARGHVLRDFFVAKRTEAPRTIEASDFKESDAQGYRWRLPLRRTVAWVADGAVWRATTRPIPTPTTVWAGGEKVTIDVPPNLGDERVVSIEIVPARVRMGEVPVAIRLVGQPEQAAKAAVVERFGGLDAAVYPDERFTVERVSVTASNGTIARADWSWEGDESLPFSSAPTFVVASGGIPARAMTNGDAPASSGDVPGVASRVAYRHDGCVTIARLSSPPIRSFSRQKGWRTRPPGEHEIRVRELTERRERAGDEDLPELPEERPSTHRLLEPPEPLSRKPLRYPNAARGLNVTGTPILDAIVSPDGNVEEVIIADDAPWFSEVAAETIATWRYRPVVRGGKPIRWHSFITLNFRLH